MCGDALQTGTTHAEHGRGDQFTASIRAAPGLNFNRLAFRATFFSDLLTVAYRVDDFFAADFRPDFGFETVVRNAASFFSSIIARFFVVLSASMMA